MYKSYYNQCINDKFRLKTRVATKTFNEPEMIIIPLFNVVNFFLKVTML